MLGLYERAAELARLVAREKDDSSGLFRIPFEHIPQFAGASLCLLAWLAVRLRPALWKEFLGPVGGSLRSARLNSTPSVSEMRQPGNRDRKGIPRVELITGDVNIHSPLPSGLASAITALCSARATGRGFRKALPPSKANKQEGVPCCNGSDDSISAQYVP